MLPSPARPATRISRARSAAADARRTWTTCGFASPVPRRPRTTYPVSHPGQRDPPGRRRRAARTSPDRLAHVDNQGTAATGLWSAGGPTGDRWGCPPGHPHPALRRGRTVHRGPTRPNLRSPGPAAVVPRIHNRDDDDEREDLEIRDPHDGCGQTLPPTHRHDTGGPEPGSPHSCDWCGIRSADSPANPPYGACSARARRRPRPSPAGRTGQAGPAGARLARGVLGTTVGGHPVAPAP